MGVTSVTKDAQALTMTLDAEFDASPERIWQLWSDPRQLERWWGPPGYPATVDSHDLRAGGRVEYHMTGPDGEMPRGYWDIIESDPPRHLLVRDGFANDDGSPNDDVPPGRFRLAIADIGGGRSRMTIESHFASADSMEQLLAMGQEQGMIEAVNQIDAILAGEPVRAR